MIPIDSFDFSNAMIQPIRRRTFYRITLSIYDGDTFEEDIVYENSFIIDANMVEEVDPLSRRLPTETFDFTIVDYQNQFDIDNPDSYWHLLGNSLPFDVEIGIELDDETIEYLPPIRYYTSDNPERVNDNIKIFGTRILSLLNMEYEQTDYGSYRLSTIAENAFTTAFGEDTDKWYCDSDLSGTIVATYLNGYTIKDVLLLVAQVSNKKLFTRYDGKVYLTSNYGVDTGELYDFNELYDPPIIVKQPVLKSEYVVINQLIADEDSPNTQIAQFTLGQSGSYHLEYPICDNPQLTTTGGAASDVTIHSGYCDFTFTKYSAGGYATIKGMPITSLQREYSEVVNASGNEDDYVDNVLCDKDALAQSVCDFRKAYMQNNMIYQLNYRGRPDYEPGDIITFHTPVGESAKGIILNNTIGFNGALNGTMIVKLTELRQNNHEVVFEAEEYAQVTFLGAESDNTTVTYSHDGFNYLPYPHIVGEADLPRTLKSNGSRIYFRFEFSSESQNKIVFTANGKVKMISPAYATYFNDTSNYAMTYKLNNPVTKYLPLNKIYDGYIEKITIMAVAY